MSAKNFFCPRSEIGIVFCNIAVVLEFGDGWLLDSLEGGVKYGI